MQSIGQLIYLQIDLNEFQVHEYHLGVLHIDLSDEG